MILNVSSRTDVAAFYSEWFMNRYNEGYVDVRNPFYEKLVHRIYFEDVEAIIFCSKNPLPLIKHLKEIDKPLLFHITLTPYNKDIEPNVISKREIIEGIKQISNIIGIDNVYVRYDPIFISDKYNIEYHIKAFDKLCILLNGYVKHIIVSLLDIYKNVKKNQNILKYKELKEDDYEKIGLNFSKIARDNGMSVQTCFEEHDLVEYGFIKGECLSKELAFKLTNKIYKKWNARKGNKCACVQMVDIGVYNTCKHFCKYCYANYDEGKVQKNNEEHYKNSSLLIGKLKQNDVIKRKS